MSNTIQTLKKIFSLIFLHLVVFTVNIEIWKKASNTLSLHTLILFSKITMVTVITLKCTKLVKYTGFRLYYYLVMWALFPSVMSSGIETRKTHSFHFSLLLSNNSGVYNISTVKM